MTQTLPVHVQRTSLDVGDNADSAHNRRWNPAEKRIMRVLCDPANHDKTHREKAALARVSERHYYQVLADPWFKEQEKQLMLSHLHGELAPIVQACIDTAKRPGRDGHADRRLVLESTGVYEPRRAVEHTHIIKPVGVIVGIAVEEL